MSSRFSERAVRMCSSKKGGVSDPTQGDRVDADQGQVDHESMRQRVRPAEIDAGRRPGLDQR